MNKNGQQALTVLSHDTYIEKLYKWSHSSNQSLPLLGYYVKKNVCTNACYWLKLA